MPNAQMKYLLTILATFILTSMTWSQIPYATQQPKWSMGIYAKDATGKKDTIYIGDDPHAQNGNGPSPYNDTQFGEIWRVPQNPYAFNLATWYWASPADSIIKVDIENYTISNYLHYTLNFDSLKFPVTVTFDLNKLLSDSLPFPSHHGQLEVFYGGQIFVTHPGMGSQGGPLEISDSVNTSCCWYCSKDSLVLTDFFGNTSRQMATISIDLKQWTGCTPLTIQNQSVNSKFLLSPNPVAQSTTLSFDNTNNEICTLTLYDYKGQPAQQTNNITGDKIEIKRNNLQSGLYFYVLRSVDRVIATGKLVFD